MKRLALCLLIALAALGLSGCQDEARVRDALIQMGYMPDPVQTPSPSPAPTPGPTPQIASVDRVVNLDSDPIPAQSLSLNRAALTLRVGKTARLKATVLPKKAADKSVVFTSSDPAICTVGPKGKLRAIAPGSATVTCVTRNGLAAQCVVTVVA